MNDCSTLPALSQDASEPLPLVERFVVTGATWEVSTNSKEILAILGDEFERKDDVGIPSDLKLHFYMDSKLPDHRRHSPPHFRALEHLYYGTYGPGDSMLVDQRNRRVVGSLTPSTARDVSYWRRVILPCLAGITSACVGVTPLHCACVAKDEEGLLLHGESGSGKSTLALSLSLNGFTYLADDCTYISASPGGLRCWGLSTPLKLLPDAVAHFPQLARLTPRQSLNGELAFEIDPSQMPGVSRSARCEPRWLVFIERVHESGAAFHVINNAEAARRLTSDLEILPSSIADQRDRQMAMIDTLVQRQCWVLRHGLPPQELAETLIEFCSR